MFTISHISCGVLHEVGVISSGRTLLSSCFTRHTCTHERTTYIKIPAFHGHCNMVDITIHNKYTLLLGSGTTSSAAVMSERSQVQIFHGDKGTNMYTWQFLHENTCIMKGHTSWLAKMSLNHLMRYVALNAINKM